MEHFQHVRRVQPFRGRRLVQFDDVREPEQDRQVHLVELVLVRERLLAGRQVEVAAYGDSLVPRIQVLQFRDLFEMIRNALEIRRIPRQPVDLRHREDEAAVFVRRPECFFPVEKITRRALRRLQHFGRDGRVFLLNHRVRAAHGADIVIRRDNGRMLVQHPGIRILLEEILRIVHVPGMSDPRMSDASVRKLRPERKTERIQQFVQRFVQPIPVPVPYAAALDRHRQPDDHVRQRPHPVADIVEGVVISAEDGIVRMALVSAMHESKEGNHGGSHFLLQNIPPDFERARNQVSFSGTNSQTIRPRRRQSREVTHEEPAGPHRKRRLEHRACERDLSALLVHDLVPETAGRRLAHEAQDGPLGVFGMITHLRERKLDVRPDRFENPVLVDPQLAFSGMAVRGNRDFVLRDFIQALILASPEIPHVIGLNHHFRPGGRRVVRDAQLSEILSIPVHQLHVEHVIRIRAANANGDADPGRGLERFCVFLHGAVTVVACETVRDAQISAFPFRAFRDFGSGAVRHEDLPLRQVLHPILQPHHGIGLGQVESLKVRDVYSRLSMARRDDPRTRNQERDDGHSSFFHSIRLLSAERPCFLEREYKQP
ncbi:MAG: hypothetical protein BWY59_01258 [Verrucomicrobia bacterium ADurb.Bin345]|nr:MAG: hypothetical protein BWY59_01258 [Verrucomicrobia bacterium ADurb.Bin345]